MKYLKTLAILLAFVFVITGAECVLAAKTVTIKVGHGHSVFHPVNQGFELFKELLEKRTHGRIKVEVYPNAQLGSESEMAEMTKMGTMQGIMFGRFEEMSPMLYAFALPFLFKDYAHVNRVLNGPLGSFYATYVEEHGLKLLGWAHSGFRQITNNVRPIRRPEDLQGLKMRTPPLENIIETMKAFGASPTPIAYPEVYMALKTKVVDGQENPYVNIYSEKFYEVQKYLTEANYIYMPGPFCVGLKWWNSLSPEDQKIIELAAKSAVAYTNALTEAEDQKYKKLIAESGVQIYELSDEERAAFIEKAQPVYDSFIKKGIVTERIIKLIHLTK
ncbi:TRAP transporter substrate-binding protein [Candidatus Aerophobetes bacterium]|nr:TRAP transporter substrate-binding protein [Candidatus Aerophobetes bacterium]